MKGLLTKDILILWRNQKRLFLIILFIGCFLSINSDATFSMTYLAIMGAMIGVTPLSYDEQENSMGFLLTLPISRGAYVRERYFFAIVAGLLCIAFGRILLFLSATFMNRETSADSLPWLPIVFALLILALSIGVLFPLRLHFGAEKVLIAQAGFFFIVFAGIAAIPFLIEKLTGVDVIPLIMSAIQQAGPGKTIMIACVMVLCMLMLSEQISEYIVKKKEY